MSKAKVVQSSPIKVALIKGVLKFFAILPMPLGVALSRGVARLMIVLNTRAFRVSNINIAICFPELDSEQRQTLVRRSLRHTSRLFVEVAKVWSKQDPADGDLGWVENVYGKDLIDKALRQGQGVLLTGAHIGNWEVLLNYLGRNYDFNCMYRPPRQLEMDEVINKGRGQNGTKMLPGNLQGVLQMVKSLNNGEVAAILADQEPGKKTGIFAPFFGKSALTMSLVQKLQQKSQAALFQIAAIRNENGNFDVYFEPIDIDQNVSELEYATQLNGVLEQMIRNFPEQYQWSYKRFKTTEDGSPNIYG